MFASAERLDCYLGGALVHSTSRGSRAGDNRRALDYRHFIEALKRKPQAFKGLTFRDELFPREAGSGVHEAHRSKPTTCVLAVAE